MMDLFSGIYYFVIYLPHLSHGPTLTSVKVNHTKILFLRFLLLFYFFYSYSFFSTKKFIKNIYNKKTKKKYKKYFKKWKWKRPARLKVIRNICISKKTVTILDPKSWICTIINLTLRFGIRYSENPPNTYIAPKLLK